MAGDTPEGRVACHLFKIDLISPKPEPPATQRTPNQEVDDREEAGEKAWLKPTVDRQQNLLDTSKVLSL